MRSTMQDERLSLATLLTYGTTVHGRSLVTTWTTDGPRRATFGDVGRNCARLASGLRDLGITGDERVATFMFNNQEHLECYGAVPAMGAVLHTLNIRLFPEQLVYIANHAEDKVVVVDAAVVPLLARVLPEMKTVEHVVVNGPLAAAAALQGMGPDLHSYAELLEGRPDTFDYPVIDERDAAAMCYTSGTTGNPKGVVYSHRSIWLHSMQVCMAESFGNTEEATTLAIVPQFHAMAWGMVHAALMSGSSLLMPDRFLQGEPLVKMIEAERPTFAAAVPTVWTDVLTHLDTHGGDISSLREVVVGGSACPPALMDAFLERYGVRIIHAWGMTETSPLGSVARPPAGVTPEQEIVYRRSQGRLPAAVQGRIVGPDGVAPKDGTTVGELEVKGPWITGSYYHDDDPAKFSPDGWLRTGDVGTLTADGYLTLTDRAKDVIKSGGEWISSVELENAIMAHPAVLEASVVGVPDEKWGERPLATVVVRAGQTVDAEQLTGFLNGRVAKWQVPERWAFVDEVPKTSVGKFDKKVIRQRYAEGELPVQLV